jgi:hypothetical protein
MCHYTYTKRGTNIYIWRSGITNKDGAECSKTYNHLVYIFTNSNELLLLQYRWLSFVIHSKSFNIIHFSVSKSLAILGPQINLQTTSDFVKPVSIHRTNISLQSYTTQSLYCSPVSHEDGPVTWVFYKAVSTRNLSASKWRDDRTQ